MHIDSRPQSAARTVFCKFRERNIYFWPPVSLVLTLYGGISAQIMHRDFFTPSHRKFLSVTKFRLPVHAQSLCHLLLMSRMSSMLRWAEMPRTCHRSVVLTKLPEMAATCCEVAAKIVSASTTGTRAICQPLCQPRTGSMHHHLSPIYYIDMLQNVTSGNGQVVLVVSEVT